MNKKAIIILSAIFLLILGTLGFLVYSRYSKKTPPSPPPAADNNPGGASGDSGANLTTTTPPSTEKFVQLTASEMVVSPVLFFNGNGVTYLNDKGQMIKSDFEASGNGQITLTRTRNLQIEAKAGITKILWPKNGDDFIAETADANGNSAFSYFNFSKGAYTDLPPQVKALEWLPSGDKILFIWVEKDAQGNERASLNAADPDTQNYKPIAELYESDDAIYLSPDGQTLAFHRTQNNSAVNKIIETTPDGKLWKDLVADGYNYGVLWSPDSQKFLFAKRERGGRNYNLWLYDLYAGEVKDLQVLGVPAKAVWASDSKTVYFAAPKEASQALDSSVPINAGNALTVDTFYKLDTRSLEKTEVRPPENLTLDGRDLFLNPSEDKLFFKNAQDGGLYYLDLGR